MTDKFINTYLKAIKEAKTDKEILSILGRLYEDGFEDGHDSSDVSDKEGGEHNVKIVYCR